MQIVLIGLSLRSLHQNIKILTAGSKLTFGVNQKRFGRRLEQQVQRFLEFSEKAQQVHFKRA